MIIHRHKNDPEAVWAICLTDADERSYSRYALAWVRITARTLRLFDDLLDCFNTGNSGGVAPLKSMSFDVSGRVDLRMTAERYLPDAEHSRLEDRIYEGWGVLSFEIDFPIYDDTAHVSHLEVNVCKRELYFVCIADETGQILSTQVLTQALLDLIRIAAFPDVVPVTEIRYKTREVPPREITLEAQVGEDDDGKS